MTRTIIDYFDDKTSRQRLIIQYDTGGWHLETADKKYYSTYHPDLLYEVQKDIEMVCSKKSTDKTPNKSDTGDDGK